MLSVKLLRFFMNLYTPIKYRQERLVQWFYSWVPSYLFQVLYIAENSMAIEEIYSSEHFKGNDGQWSKQAPKTFPKGFYLFQFWNVEKIKIERILLHSDHLLNACQLSSLDALWMLDEEALMKCLLEYLHTHKKRIEIIDLYLNKKPIFKRMKEFHTSLGIPYNWTPRLIYLMDQCQQGQPIDDKQEDLQVMYFTWDLEECVKTNDECLVG